MFGLIHVRRVDLIPENELDQKSLSESFGLGKSRSIYYKPERSADNVPVRAVFRLLRSCFRLQILAVFVSDTLKSLFKT